MKKVFLSKTNFLSSEELLNDVIGVGNWKECDDKYAYELTVPNDTIEGFYEEYLPNFYNKLKNKV